MHRVGMKENATGTSQCANLLPGLDAADLVIGGHHGDERRVGPNCSFHVGQSHPTILIRGQYSQLETEVVA